MRHEFFRTHEFVHKAYCFTVEKGTDETKLQTTADGNSVLKVP